MATFKTTAQEYEGPETFARQSQSEFKLFMALKLFLYFQLLTISSLLNTYRYRRFFPISWDEFKLHQLLLVICFIGVQKLSVIMCQIQKYLVL